MNPGNKRYILILMSVFVISLNAIAQQVKNNDLIEQAFTNPPQSAKPWVFWYWLHGAISKEGITADLEAMKEVGIGGAYLMPIRDTNSKIPFQPQARQLTPEWWVLVNFALQEAKRLQLQIGVHVSDGFALAGGPWITPALSMQKLVWTKAFIQAGNKRTIVLQQPETKENYYKDIAAFAYPANYNNEILVKELKPVVTTSNGTGGSFLPDVNSKNTFRSDTTCWIQYAYTQQVTVRQIKIKKQTNAYQSQRFIIQKSDDGIHFTIIDSLHAPRHGWQDWEEGYTHAVKTFAAKYIRFVWQKEGTEPGSEDLDAAKWKPVLRVQGIFVSDEPVINNIEAKNGSMWRIAANTTTGEVRNTDAVPLDKIVNLTNKLSADGKLNWLPPTNQSWVVVRIGHTSTGYTNATAGGGKGLECDKFSTAAATLQFNNWFGKFYTETDPGLAKEVIKVFHIDSWECGTQNWSSNFAKEFKKKRGYDLLPYLLVMTGTPVNDAARSEKILHDVRQTIAELVNDKFYATLNDLAHKKNCLLSAESIAPTFVSDALMHYKYADIPMGEFWLNSPTHDKPNDMLDAISGGHIYGKHIIQAEAFTTLRSDWSEHPGSIKVIGDRAFAAGINKLSLHVFMHNPWLDKKPGMTLDGIGLFYQRDQTWFKQSKAWIEYITRCQALLQLGKPVVDIAVFTGEEIPGRSVLPERLVNTLPGLFGKEKVEAERKRLLNDGQPQRTIPAGVTHSANMADPENYVNALNGYSYDCFNPDVLMQMTVANGRIITAGGASYKILLIPADEKMLHLKQLSKRVMQKIVELVQQGAIIIADGNYANDLAMSNPGIQFLNNMAQYGKGKIIKAPYIEKDLEQIGILKELLFDTVAQPAFISKPQMAPNLAVCRRDMDNKSIYFISNQNNQEQYYYFWFNYKGLKPEIYDPVTGEIEKYCSADTSAGGIYFGESFKPYESKFIVFNKPGIAEKYPWYNKKGFQVFHRSEALINGWEISFKNSKKEFTKKVIVDTARLALGYVLEAKESARLKSWTEDTNDDIKYFSGTAVYRTTYIFDRNKDTINTIELRMDTVCNIASVKVNGIDCGTRWISPYSVDIKKAIKQGINAIEIEVTNTWRNRLVGDELMPDEKQTWYNSPYKMKEKPLLPAGIIGQVEIHMQYGDR